MASARVVKDLDVSTDELWALVEDFGACDWIPAPVELEGQGVGMVRVMGGTVREKLEEVDEPARTIRYSIEDAGNPFPVTGYLATMVVSEAPGGARLDWSCRFEPDGVSEADATARIEGMYATMVGWIGETLAKRSA